MHWVTWCMPYARLERSILAFACGMIQEGQNPNARTLKRLRRMHALVLQSKATRRDKKRPSEGRIQVGKQFQAHLREYKGEIPDTPRPTDDHAYDKARPCRLHHPHRRRPRRRPHLPPHLHHHPAPTLPARPRPRPRRLYRYRYLCSKSSVCLYILVLSRNYVLKCHHGMILVLLLLPHQYRIRLIVAQKRVCGLEPLRQSPRQWRRPSRRPRR